MVQGNSTLPLRTPPKEAISYIKRHRYHSSVTAAAVSALGDPNENKASKGRY